MTPRRDITPHIQVSPTAAGRSRSDPAIDRTVRIGETAGSQEHRAPASREDDLHQLYAIQGKIGDGGMGVVYLAKDRRLNRYVAIKRLNSQAQSIVSLRHRFLHEARAVAALNHIHIVHIYGLGEDAEGPYIVMEYVPGPPDPSGPRSGDGRPAPNAPVTLEQQVARNGQLTANEAIDLLVKVSKAIAYAHAAGVIHRDLKPTNVLLDVTGEPKIVDFGLARLLREEESKLTVQGEKLLSLGYGAPEQERDASVSDERADVYGLGALLYFAITGQNPRYFREQDIPVALRDVLVKALATDREQRWPSAAAFCEALQAVQSRTRVETPSAKTTWRCKWCDTVNPLTIHFCSECGWDGVVNCPECGAESFVGVQYCGTCGADARAYESMATLLRRIRAGIDAREFERAISFAGRTHGFEPAGPSGRHLLKEIHDLRDLAGRQVARRDQLKELVPIELHAENFERATDFIREYRSLSGQAQAFAEEERQIPELRLKRDQRRIRRAMRDGEWEQAGRLCDELLRGAADHPECLALRRTIRRQRMARRAGRGGLAVAAVCLLYVLAMPPVLLLSGRPVPPATAAAYVPSRWLYLSSGVARPLTAYARLWGETNLLSRFEPPAPPSAALAQHDPEELRALRATHARQLAEITSEQDSYASSWPAEYLREIDVLMERRQTVGDYEAWTVLQAERQQFQATRRIGNSPADEYGELLALKQRYRRHFAASRIDSSKRVVTCVKKYLNDLTDLQRTYTKDARMGDAAAVNTEIRRVRGAPEWLEAEKLLAEYGATETETPPVLTAGTPAGERLAELTPLRQRYDEQLAAVESDYARELEKWPDKYIGALKGLMERYQGAGDYTGWDAAKNELERFEMDRVVQPKDMVGEPKQLGELQRQHVDMLTDYRARRARSIVSLADQQVKQLTEHQRTYTMSGDMDAAGQVNAEIRRIRASPEVMAAQAELAPAKVATAG